MSDGFQPLNPMLYSALRNRFGRVELSNPGMAARPEPYTSTTTGRMNFLWKGGEYYKVNCPFCHDTKFRLWVSYLWGHYDADYRTNHRDLAICYNESCLDAPGTRDQLFFQLFGLMGAQQVAQATILPGRTRPAGPIGSPGRVAVLSDLPPNHPACAYMASRGYDPASLGRLYGVGYCEEPSLDYPAMWNRLVIPICQDGQFVGFQGRVIGDEPNRPRYYNPPNSYKTNWLYNRDQAKRYSVLVITEGATKVWRVGPMAVATFGKTISGQQPTLIANLARNCDRVVLYYDGEAWKPSERNPDRPPPAVTALETLLLHIPREKLVVVRLGDQQAPDNMSTEANHDILLGALERTGWTGRLDAHHNVDELAQNLPPRRVRHEG